MKIRKATPEDIDHLMYIFDKARLFMNSTGNPKQWINGYPGKALIEDEIKAQHCYICENEMGKPVATFCLIAGPDPTYATIEDGQWLSDQPYHVIHRLASDGSTKGTAQLCIDWCKERCGNLRVDTHNDNKVMQHILLKNGFIRCGIIYVANGTPRIAYQIP